MLVNVPETFLISGHIVNNRVKIPVAVQIGVPVIAFSCFDEIHLYFTEPEKEKVYSVRFCCCRNWGVRSLRATEIPCLGSSGGCTNYSDFVEICIEITDLRSSREYHYNTSGCSNRPSETFTVQFNENRISLRAYECPCCYFRFDGLSALRDHLDLIHKRLDSRISNGELHLDTKEEANSVDIRRTSGASKSSMPQKFSDAIGCCITTLSCHGTVASRQPSDPKDFFYLKRRNTKLVEYHLSDYGLLIDREFDTLDYSMMVSNHLNLGLEDRAFQIDKIEYEIMRRWNYFRAGGSDAEACLYKVISTYSLSHLVAKLIGILYNRGILSSERILRVLTKAKDENRQTERARTE